MRRVFRRSRSRAQDGTPIVQAEPAPPIVQPVACVPVVVTGTPEPQAVAVAGPSIRLESCDGTHVVAALDLGPHARAVTGSDWIGLARVNSSPAAYETYEYNSALVSRGHVAIDHVATSLGTTCVLRYLDANDTLIAQSAPFDTPCAAVCSTAASLGTAVVFPDQFCVDQAASHSPAPACVHVAPQPCPSSPRAVRPA